MRLFFSIFILISFFSCVEERKKYMTNNIELFKFEFYRYQSDLEHLANYINTIYISSGESQIFFSAKKDKMVTNDLIVDRIIKNSRISQISYDRGRGCLYGGELMGFENLRCKLLDDELQYAYYLIFNYCDVEFEELERNGIKTIKLENSWFLLREN